jgi:hypothetical protein
MKPTFIALPFALGRQGVLVAFLQQVHASCVSRAVAAKPLNCP